MEKPAIKQTCFFHMVLTRIKVGNACKILSKWKWDFNMWNIGVCLQVQVWLEYMMSVNYRKVHRQTGRTLWHVPCAASCTQSQWHCHVVTPFAKTVSIESCKVQQAKVCNDFFYKCLILRSCHTCLNMYVSICNATGYVVLNYDCWKEKVTHCYPSIHYL